MSGNKITKALTTLAVTLMLLSCAIMARAPATISVKRGQHPYLVLITQVTGEGSHYYTGILLSPTWVLTLSEDLYEMTKKDISSLTVFADLTRFADIGRAPRRSVTEFYKTVNEGKEKYPCMMLLLLSDAFASAKDVRPVQVNSGEIGTKCLVAGWATPIVYDDRGPELVQTELSTYNASQCAGRFNAVGFESQMCGVQSYEYSFLPGSALLCSNALTAVKSIDTYLKHGNSDNRVVLYVRVKTFTTWMRSLVQNMKRMVYLKGSSNSPDDLSELWERHRGSRRSRHHGESDNKSSGGSVFSHCVGLTLSCILVVLCKLATLLL